MLLDIVPEYARKPNHELRQALSAAGITAEAVADANHISMSTYFRWIRKPMSEEQQREMLTKALLYVGVQPKI